MTETITLSVLKAVEKSPNSIARLDVLKSLRLTDEQSLKIILSRLKKRAEIIGLKRSVYSSNPIADAFVCAQNTYNGYIGLHAALYLHKFIDEIPFEIHIITRNTSARKRFSEHEFVAIALKERAVAGIMLDKYNVSSKAKTIFDCIYLLNSEEINEKILNGAKTAGVNTKDVKQLHEFILRFGSKRRRKSMLEFLKKLRKVSG